jgi:predicted PurR-regulated permease PerM
MSELSLVLDGLRDVIRGIDDVSEKVSEAINEGDGAAPVEEPEEEAVRVPRAFDALSLAPSFAAQLLIVIGAFFFFLISRHEIYEWAARRQDGRSEGPTARTLKEAERLVARYFLTISIINASLGLIVGIVFHAIGMPAPYAWGFVAAALNYILYIGPAVFAVAALLGGLLAFDGAEGVLPAVLYVCINGIEGNFVTPTLVGRNMQVNPLLVFLSLVFWLWMWGPIGGVVAIPLLLYALAVVSGFGVTEPIAFAKRPQPATVGGGSDVSGPRPGT